MIFHGDSYVLLLYCMTRMQHSGLNSLNIARESLRERHDEIDIPDKALRVIPRGKQRLTVYRPHQVFSQK